MTTPLFFQKERLARRSMVIQAVRDFFTRNGYLEVETPIRCPSLIPEAHIDPVESGTHFLQASPELCMKRLLSRGHDKIFQICKCFRKDERGRYHLPELTMLEWYAKGETYQDLMDQCQNLTRFVAGRLDLGGTLPFQGKTIDLKGKWERLSVADAFIRHAGTSLAKAMDDGTFDEIMSFQIEPRLGNTAPVFLMDYPSQFSSLARLNRETPETAERFEFYIAGIELANGFTELNDPGEQRLRFEIENRRRISLGKKAVAMPEAFLKDLSAMPDAAGIALGIDRFVMLFCDARSVDDIVAFTPEDL